MATNHVTFERSARTAIHTRRLGQTQIVTIGGGQLQSESGTAEAVCPGDGLPYVVRERHWHGATAAEGMRHIAVQESDLQGSSVTRQKPVADYDYRA